MSNKPIVDKEAILYEQYVIYAKDVGETIVPKKDFRNEFENKVLNAILAAMDEYAASLDKADTKAGSQEFSKCKKLKRCQQDGLKADSQDLKPPNHMLLKELKLTKKQKEIIKKMQDGWIIFNGRSESTERMYYGITKGFDTIYFNATVWHNLIVKGLVSQRATHPFNYELTDLGETINI